MCVLDKIATIENIGQVMPDIKYVGKGGRDVFDAQRTNIDYPFLWVSDIEYKADSNGDSITIDPIISITIGDTKTANDHSEIITDERCLTIAKKILNTIGNEYTLDLTRTNVSIMESTSADEVVGVIVEIAFKSCEEDIPNVINEMIKPLSFSLVDGVLIKHSVISQYENAGWEVQLYDEQLGYTLYVELSAKKGGMIRYASVTTTTGSGNSIPMRNNPF